MQIKEAMMRVKCGVVVGLVACGLGSGCAERSPVQSIRSLEVEGTYAAGFEYSEFRPSAQQYQGQRWWLQPNADLAKRYGESRPKTEAPSIGRGPAVRVRVRGRLIGPGQYGHLGRWKYQFSVDEVLEMR